MRHLQSLQKSRLRQQWANNKQHYTAVVTVSLSVIHDASQVQFPLCRHSRQKSTLPHSTDNKQCRSTAQCASVDFIVAVLASVMYDPIQINSFTAKLVIAGCTSQMRHAENPSINVRPDVCLDSVHHIRIAVFRVQTSYINRSS